MAEYATAAELRDYADLTGGSDADLERIIQRAQVDVEGLVGPQGQRPVTQTRVFLPASMPANQALALKRAVCAQAEYRIAMGEPFFVKAQHQSVSGPQFSTSGRLPHIGPKVGRELRGSGLVNRWGVAVH